MGQKVHPLGFRLGISKDHNSLWFSKSRNYLFFVQEDLFIRKYIQDSLLEASLSNIEIKRKLNFIIINLYVANPSIVMGPSGNSLHSLRLNLSNLLASKYALRDVSLNVIEVLNPDSNARFLSDFVRQQLEKRVPFRRIIKSTILKAQKAGLKGIKIQISGRLNGAEIARTEWFREGQVPLHTLKANIDYSNQKARLIYVFWISKIIFFVL